MLKNCWVRWVKISKPENVEKLLGAVGEIVTQQTQQILEKKYLSEKLAGTIMRNVIPMPCDLRLILPPVSSSINRPASTIV